MEGETGKETDVKDCLACHSQGTERSELCAFSVFLIHAEAPSSSSSASEDHMPVGLSSPRRARTVSLLPMLHPRWHSTHLTSGGFINVAGQAAGRVGRGRVNPECQQVCFGNRKTLLPTSFYAILMDNNFEIGP